MKTARISVASIFIILLCAFGTIQAASQQVIDMEGNGYLELYNGKKVLHVKGSYYDMGFQYGAMMQKELDGVKKLLAVLIEDYGLPGSMVDTAASLAMNLYYPYFDQWVRDYIAGAVEGAHSRDPNAIIDTDTLVLLNAIIDIGGAFGSIDINCDSFAAWGSLTEDGKVFQTRNVDLFYGYGLENYAAIVVNKPTGKIPYCNPGWWGLFGTASGLSAKGIGVGQIWGYSMDNAVGRPWPILVAKALSEKSSCVEVAYEFRDEPNNTYGSNFIFGDATNNMGVAVEVTARMWAMFYDNDPRELEAQYNGEPYAILIDDAVFRADTAMDPDIRSRQTASNGPDGDPRTSGAYRNRYKGQADRIIAYRDAGIPIGHKEAETISRETAMPSSSLQCCVYANSDLQLWVADAWYDSEGNPRPACENKYFHYNFDKALPTVDLRINKQSFRPGDTLTVTLELSNYGNGSEVLVYTWLQFDGEYFFYPSWNTKATSMPLNMTKNYNKQLEIINVMLPPSTPKGTYNWGAALVDAQSGALIDFSLQEMTFWH